MIVKIILFLSFLFTSLLANDFKEIIEISLKKDEYKKILVKYDSYERVFKFRWTLYKNGGLVIHRFYDKDVSQNILYLREKNQSFRVELKPRGADLYQVPYILVKFEEFNTKKNRAKFKLMLSDNKMQINLEDIK